MPRPPRDPKARHDPVEGRDGALEEGLHAVLGRRAAPAPPRPNRGPRPPAPRPPPPRGQRGSARSTRPDSPNFRAQRPLDSASVTLVRATASAVSGYSQISAVGSDGPPTRSMTPPTNHCSRYESHRNSRVSLLPSNALSSRRRWEASAAAAASASASAIRLSPIVTVYRGVTCPAATPAGPAGRRGHAGPGEGACGRSRPACTCSNGPGVDRRRRWRPARLPVRACAGARAPGSGLRRASAHMGRRGGGPLPAHPQRAGYRPGRGIRPTVRDERREAEGPRADLPLGPPASRLHSVVIGPRCRQDREADVAEHDPRPAGQDQRRRPTADAAREGAVDEAESRRLHRAGAGLPTGDRTARDDQRVASGRQLSRQPEAPHEGPDSGQARRSRLRSARRRARSARWRRRISKVPAERAVPPSAGVARSRRGVYGRPATTVPVSAASAGASRCRAGPGWAPVGRCRRVRAHP